MGIKSVTSSGGEKSVAIGGEQTPQMAREQSAPERRGDGEKAES